MKRRDFVNKILAGGFKEIELIVDPSCKNTIIDFEFIKEAPDGGKLKEKAKDENGDQYEKYGHTSDCSDYMIVKAFANYV